MTFGAFLKQGLSSRGRGDEKLSIEAKQDLSHQRGVEMNQIKGGPDFGGWKK